MRIVQAVTGIAICRKHNLGDVLRDVAGLAVETPVRAS
jgi:hypothetical protein